jgi:elongation factor P--beta-lysine ligase
MDPKPPWWDWDVELSAHVFKRMVDRGFSETDLRQMIEEATRIEASASHGRFLVTSRFHRTFWIVVVEPDLTTRTIVVITAYPVF